jgi:hypothetical protein
MSNWFWPARIAIVNSHTMASLFLSLLGAPRSAFRTLCYANMSFATGDDQRWVRYASPSRMSAQWVRCLSPWSTPLRPLNPRGPRH